MVNENDTYNTVTSYIGITLLGSICRSILTADRRCALGIIRGCVLATFVAWMTGTLLSNYKYDTNSIFCILGVSSFLADDILLGAVKLGTTIKDNPQAVLDYVINILTKFKSK